MNYKLLFPTYRNRYNFVEKTLASLQFERGLNLGTGEGDYDIMLAPHCKELIGCDINAQDIEFAKNLNKDLKNIQYRVENALNLTFSDETFDLIVSCEVIEHVGQPQRMMQEIYRVLRKGGTVVLTFPSLAFPFSYDPINRILSFFNKNSHISAGAYAFGHDYLISPPEFRRWVKDLGFTIVEERGLSFYLVGLLEMYWTGIVQKIFKGNASNLSENKREKKMAMRPSTQAPALAHLTDFILNIDRFVFNFTNASIGKGFVLKK